MKRLIFSILFLLAAIPLPAQVQSTSIQGQIAATSAACLTAFSCVWESVLPNNASTTTINLSGTFTATLLVEESNNGGQTWATAATLSAAGTTTYSVNGFTDIRMRCSAYTSGTAVVTISTGLNTGLQGPPGPAGSGGITSPNNTTIYAWDPKYNLPQPSKFVCDATFTNGSPTVTTPVTDRPFLSTDSFAVVFAGSAQCGGNSQQPVTLTTATVGTYTTATRVDNHTITLAGNALATCTPTVAQGGCALVWGPDHTAAIQAAFNDAANNCGTLILPAGGLTFTSVITNTTSLCPTTTGGNDVDESLTVQGQGWNATYLYFVPAFNFTSTGMFAVTNTAQIRIRLHDFQVASFTPATAGQAGQNGFKLFFNSEFDHMSVFNFFQSNGPNFVGVNVQGVFNAITRVHDNLFLNVGFSALVVSNADINVDNNWIQGSTNCFATIATIRLKTRGNRMTICGTNGAAGSSTASEWDSDEDVFDATGTSLPVLATVSGSVFRFHNAQVSGAQTTGPTVNNPAGGTMIFDGEQNIIKATSGTANAISNAGTLVLRNTTISSSGGTGLANAATGSVTVKEGNSFANAITNASGGVFQGQQHLGVESGACTGVVTSATTVGLYQLGQYTTTTCVTAVVGVGQVMSHSGSVYGLFCTATAGNQAADACTVVKNGAAQTMTCSLNAVTNCFDGTTGHVVTFIAGDILSIEAIAGVATTLANVKGTLVTN